MLSVLTYNIRYGNHLDQIIPWVADHKESFDIICFQEFPLAKLDEFLKRIANHYDYQFSQNFIKKKKTYGQLTVFNTGKVTLLESKAITLGQARLERSNKRGERSSLLTRFSYNKKKFLLVNTHLVCIAFNSARLKQLEKILTVADDMTSAKTPMILVGDFNYTSLIRQKKLLSFMQNYGFTNGYKTSTFRLLFVKYQLDYLFYRHCVINNITIPRVKYSDHFPAEFTISL